MFAEFTIDYLAKADHWAYVASKASADAVSEFENLKELGDDLLATLTAKELNGSDKSSRTEAEMRARLTEDWKQYKEGLAQSRLKAAIAKAKYTSAQRHYDCVVMGLAYKRDEMKRLGAQ